MLTGWHACLVHVSSEPAHREGSGQLFDQSFDRSESRDDKPSIKAESADNESRMSLAGLVVIGTVAGTVVGGALFGWLAWLLSRQPAPLRGDSGWWTWLSHADGAALFDAARTTATIVAVVGLGGAALVAYRRQDTAERAHRVTIQAQLNATEQLALDTKKYDLDRSRHQLEVDRRKDDRERNLRESLSVATNQLGSPDYGVRTAGAYALASLADDWHRFGNDIQRQVCVDLLCAQLRRARIGSVIRAGEDPQQDLEVRKAIVNLIRSHRPLRTDSPDSWRSCSLDLSGADLSGFSFSETDLTSTSFYRATLRGTDLFRCNLSHAMVIKADLTSANLSEADLTEARLQNARTDAQTDEKRPCHADFKGAKLHRASLASTFLPNAEFDQADLREAVFQAARLEQASFAGADLTDAYFDRAHLSKADFRDANLGGVNFVLADVSEATFAGAKHNTRTNWANGAIPGDIEPLDNQGRMLG